jgi:hypothetical protein
MRSKRFVLVCVGAPENDNCALLLKKAGLGEAVLTMPIPMDLCSTEDHGHHLQE